MLNIQFLILIDRFNILYTRKFQDIRYSRFYYINLFLVNYLFTRDPFK